MPLPPLAHLGARRLPALACLAAALLAASPASRAAIEITQLDPDAGGVLNFIRTGPLAGWPSLSGAGQLATARYTERRVSRLVDFALDEPVLLDLQADSGWKSTTVAGQAISAYDSVDNEAFPSDGFPTPARARSAAFENHVQAHTGQKFRMVNDVPVVVAGAEYAAFQLYVLNSNAAYAGSGWYDTWQAQQAATATLTLRLDGGFSHDSGCQGVCGMSIPAGITSTTLQKPQMAFEANFTVLDLDTLVNCDDPDECADPGPQPMAVAMVRVRYIAESNATFPQALDLPLALSFEAEAGHRYLTIGAMQADAVNGGEVSFYNSFRLTGVQAPAGTFLSAALGGTDLSSHFAQPVPEPGTLALWAAGALGLWRLRRRRHDAA